MPVRWYTRCNSPRAISASARALTQEFRYDDGDALLGLTDDPNEWRS